MRSEKMRKWHSRLSVGVGLVLMLVGAVAWAQQSQTQPGPSPTQAAPFPAQTQQPAGQESPSPQPPGGSELLHVLVGQSLEVTSPSPIQHVSVSSPGIVDAVIEDSNHIKINGKAAGGVSLEVLDETGESHIFYVYVDLEASAQAGALPETPPANSAMAQVQKKTSAAWLGWGVFASVLLLAGTVLAVRRRRQPASNGFDPRAARVVANYGCAEPAPVPTQAAGDEEPPLEVTAAPAVTRPAENSEKINRDLGEPGSRQFQEQAEAAAERQREQLRELKQVVEESKQQLAGLAEAKLASLMQAVRDEHSQQLAQSIRERAQMMQEAADAGVKSIKQAGAEAIAQIEAAEQKRESGYQQLAQAFQEQTQAMHEAADAHVKSITRATEEAVAESQAAAQKREASILACASAAEERLAGVSSVLEALQARVGELAEDLQSESAKRVGDFEKAARESGGRLSQQLQQQAQEAVNQLREEVRNSGRIVEESKQQLASLAEAKLASFDQAAADALASLGTAMAQLREEFHASGRTLAESRQRLANLAEARIALLNQVASRAVADVGAQQRRFRRQYAPSQKEPGDLFTQRSAHQSTTLLGDLFTRRSAHQSTTFDNNGAPSKRRAVAVMLTLVAGLFLVVTGQQLGVYLTAPPPPVEMHLQAEAPPDYADASPSWSAKRRAKEEETAQAYWRAAAFSLQRSYPFGTRLPADPLPEFQIDNQYDSKEGAKAVTETRARYWEKLRTCWVQRRFWIESQPVKETWADRLRRVWERF